MFSRQLGTISTYLGAHYPTPFFFLYQFLITFSLVHYFLLHYSQVISLFLYLLCCKVVILPSI